MEYLTEQDVRQAKSVLNTGASFTQTKDTYFTIKDLAEFSGVKPHTIRIWEQRFRFFNPQRTETSRRFYTGQQVNFFLQVCLLKQNGYRMTHIEGMSKDEKNKIIEGINGPQKYTRSIYQLIESMIAMDTFNFNKILDSCVAEWGIHETLQCIVAPFSERTCLFESPEKKTYRQNLFLIMEGIKQKIYLGIESAEVKSGEEPTVLLFPSSSGDLLLLYIHYLVKKAGFRTIYLGKYSSISELSMICTRKKPRYIITDLAENVRNTDLVDFIKRLPYDLPQSHFISTGKPLAIDTKTHHYHYIENPVDIIHLLENLKSRSG